MNEPGITVDVGALPILLIGPVFMSPMANICAWVVADDAIYGLEPSELILKTTWFGGLTDMT
jgi:hypothetical protein